MKAALAAVTIVVLVGGCSHDKSPTVAAKTMSADTLKKDCANPQWREQNLGLWYSVCRQPLRW